MLKTYEAPKATIETCDAVLPLCSSTLLPGQDTQTITPSDDDYDGEFAAKASSVFSL